MDGLAHSMDGTNNPYEHGSTPMDEANKSRLDQAKESYKTQQKSVGGELSQFLNRMAMDIESIDRDQRLTLFRQQIKAHQYMDGNFYGYVDTNCEWRQKQKGSDEVWYSDNQLYPYLRTALMELSRSRTELVINPAVITDPKLAAAAKFAKMRYDVNRDRTFNARLKQTENGYALLNGITYRYTFPEFNTGRCEKIPTLMNPDEKGDMMGGGDEPPIGDDTDSTASVKLCAMCASRVHAEGSADDKCQECGSEMFIDVGGMMDSPGNVIGYEELPNAENAWIVPNPIGVIVSLQASRIEETPFLKWKQQIPRAVLQSKFKGLDLPSTGTPSIELRYITNQQKISPENGSGNTLSIEDANYSTTNGGRELELLELEQVWLDYALYCDVKFNDDMPMGKGKVLKAGQHRGDLFPDGLFYYRVGDLIPFMRNEDKNRRWTSAPYGMRPGSMYGSGSHSTMADQEIINDIQTLTMANMWSNGVPRTFVDPSIIAELSADPQIPTKIDMSGVDGNLNGRGYWQTPPTALSPEIYAMRQERVSAIQQKIGALSGTGAGGLSDAQEWGNTATAISIKRDMAVGRFAPDLALMADQLDKMQAYQFLENEQQYFTPDQWERERGDYDADALKAFLDCDIRRDLVITVADGSYMPKSDAQMQSKLMGYAQLIPVLAQMQNPEVMAYAGELFGIPEHLSGWNADREYSRRIMDRFQGLAEMFVEEFGDVPTNSLEDETVVQIAQRINEYSKMPVDVFLDNHQAMQDAIKDWRTTDKGQQASNVLLAAVAYRYNLHQEGIAKQMAITTQTQITGQEPIRAEQMKELEAQKADAAASQGAATQASEADTEQQVGAQGAEKLMEYADRDDARTHEAEMQDAKHAHEKEITAAKLMADAAAKQV